jgi:23S rRNA pseudouridine2605 synthase
MNESQSDEEQKESVGTQEEMRLSRFLAQAGIASRRHAEEVISAGRVQVNGQVVNTQGTRVHPEHDQVSVDGKRIQIAAQKVYLILNKPAGYVSTAQDPQHRPTVLALLSPELRRLRVYPVGRLDIDTSGLILLTNDGDFALRLTHPRYSTFKHYEAVIQGSPTTEALEQLRHGVSIREDDGNLFQTSPAQVRLVRTSAAQSTLRLTLHEGHKRQVRRMLVAVGHPVRHLTRVGVGTLTLQGVAPGTWRYLTAEEVQHLKDEG